MATLVRGWAVESGPDGARVAVAGPLATAPRPGNIEIALAEGRLATAAWLLQLGEARRVGGLAAWTVVRRSPSFDPRYLTPAENGLVASLAEQARPPSGLAGSLARSGAARFLASLPPAPLASLAAIPGAGPLLYGLASAGLSAGATALGPGSGAGALFRVQGATTPLPAGKLAAIGADPSRENVKAVALAQGAEAASALSLALAPAAAAGNLGAAVASAGARTSATVALPAALDAATGRALDFARTLERGAASLLGGFTSALGLAPVGAAIEAAPAVVRAASNGNATSATRAGAPAILSTLRAGLGAILGGAR